MVKLIELGYKEMLARHEISLNPYNTAEVVALAEEMPNLCLAPNVEKRIRDGAKTAAAMAQAERPAYGINTGFGALAEIRVAKERLGDLQRNHILSHAAGIGPEAEPVVARLALLLKVLSLRWGYSGITLETVHRLLQIWNAGYWPIIPTKGTVGASGDLAPLAHMALPILGQGALRNNTRTISNTEIRAFFRWPESSLRPKEGLALTNGVQFITAVACVELARLGQLVDFADIVASLSLQAFACSKEFFDLRYVQTSFHHEREVVARRIGELSRDGNHASLSVAAASRQDPYSFRCIPQIHGAARQLLAFGQRTITDELNGVSDNPLLFADDEAMLSGGNLHGQSVAFAADLLAMAAADMSSVSERRSYQMLAGRRGLPDFLTREPGVNSGFMVAQYTAAALVSESKTLCHPASVDTIPTCQLQEDHVSMGGGAVEKLRTVVGNLQVVLAIELLIAAAAADLQSGLALSRTCEKLRRAFRTIVPQLENDRVIAPDIDAAVDFVKRNASHWHDGFARESGPFAS